MSRNILQGLVGAWCPSLGPSGYTLLDRSGRGQHGTLTNMDAGSDWVGTSGGWALDFDGVNDKVTSTHQMGTGIDRVTLAFWAKKPAANTIAICSLGSESTNSRFHVSWFSDSEVYCTCENGSPSFGNVTLSYAASWFHFVLSYNGGQSTNAARLRPFINGTQRTLAFSGTIPSTAISSNVVAIGAGSGAFATAQIDEVAIWNRDVSPAEASGIYNMGRGGLGRLLTPQRRSYAFRVPAAAVKSYLFTNRGQVIGGGTL